MKQTEITEEEFARLASEVGEWGEANFGTTTPENANDPALGFLEEIGELTHAILKKRQGIRGTPEEHDAAARDALGDMGIFLLHLWYRKTKLEPESIPNTLVFFESLSASEETPEALQSALATLAHKAGTLLDDEEWWFPDSYSEAAQSSSFVAYLLGVDFWPQVRDTWEKIVSKRNWKANPQGTPDPA